MGAIAREWIDDLPSVGLSWGAEGLRYPGIRLTHTADKYYDLNHGRLLKGLRTSVRFWKELPLSLIGRGAITKMVILLRCLYGLQNALYEVRRSHFTQIDSLILELLWANRRKRVGLPKLRQTWECGRIELRHMELYYLASHLHHAVHWLDLENNWDKKRLQGVCDEHTLSALLLGNWAVREGVPYIVQMVCNVWTCVVSYVQAFMRVALDMSMKKWRDGDVG
ncbi:hypothetical protein NDU88_001513 [Pleurodeles waltl]|uniref:Uncharacterized protein n=1 Tax=Pleurodeles waltl TaxID=8319 RepID=A0AAV7MSZ3_PLEWA|nr:hypothetical protein NDU88_001513 [Pleurodeles waltl]